MISSKPKSSYELSSDSRNSKNNITTSSENKLKTNTLALTRVFSSSETSSKSSSSESDSEEYEINDNISLNGFFAILRSIVDSFICTQPKEVSINGYNMINAEFIALKDPVLNHFTSNFSDKEQEKFWYEITMIFSYILQPISDLIRIASQQVNTLPLEGSQPEAKIL
ncbi:hypothetical protein F8M41_012503 [Gigaspora margarita]|uniref:Uncharacterized protein n=1 Tax=Gigaspora margarita TaxID=4874 RepID=A0A8H3WYY6_GIGMA|nr:hypothetical protein F8M41_012503 [Gigaspora margarita]